MKLLIASNNKHKIDEIKAVLSGKFDTITTLQEVGIECDPEESGETFLDNALIKARAIARYTDCAVLADDTGLCVNALGGLPGVHSARYAGDHDSAANRHKLLDDMESCSNRTAYFQTVVVLLYPDGTFLTGEGKVEGRISTYEQGENGFGYDSIFYCDDLRKTFAQASTAEKLTVSHRSRALNDLLDKLQ